MKIEKTSYIVAGMLMAILLYSCANIGRPEGGPRDMDPPIFVSSDPAPNSLNVSKNKIEIMFNEIVTLKDQQTKVVVSPVQKENPVIRALGKKVTVEFRDTLKPNTTYSVDFADAIQDNNEGNPLENFAIAFSTGDSIDSLAISGMVLQARDLEPAQKVLVGIHSNLEDSAFKKEQFLRIGRTNSLGQFTIRNLKPGRYRVYALNDLDRDYRYSRSEDCAYLQDIIVPSSHPITTMDTIFTQKNLVDTVVEGRHTVFTPNDIFLSLFNEGYRAQYMKAYERPEDNKLLFKFGAYADSLPEIRIMKPEPQRADWYRMECSEHNDSLVYWLTDSALIKSDSITVEMKYLRTDSTENLTLATDTLEMVLKSSYKKQKERNAKELAKKEKERVETLKKERESQIKEQEKAIERRRKEAEEQRKFNKDGATDSLKLDDLKIINYDTVPLDTLPPRPVLNFSITSAASLDVFAPIQFTSAEPLDSVRREAFHLTQFNDKDSVWTDVPIDSVMLEKPWNPLIYIIEHEWEPGATYKIDVDSSAVKGIYGVWNTKMEQKFTIKSLEEYSNLFFNITNAGDSAFVELLDGSDKVVRTAPVIKGAAEILNLAPAEYYARIVLDRNGNGQWDSGNFDLHIQPEEVYYFSKPLKLKKNWDVEQSWNIYELPVDKQKPERIKKNKPEKKKRWDEEQQNQQDQMNNQQDEEDEFAPNIYTGNKYTDYNRNNR